MTQGTKSTSRGVTLPVILFFLLVITIGASYGIRRLMQDESRALRNPLDHEVAKQAAEAALRDAERDLRLAFEPGDKPEGATCARGRDRPLPEALIPGLFDASCPRGQCHVEPANTSASAASSAALLTSKLPWNDQIASNCSFAGSVPLGLFTGATRLASVTRQPDYLIEHMRRGVSDYFRITARGFSADGRTSVMVQSYFQLPE